MVIILSNNIYQHWICCMFVFLFFLHFS